MNKAKELSEIARNARVALAPGQVQAVINACESAALMGRTCVYVSMSELNEFAIRMLRDSSFVIESIGSNYSVSF